ncbi:MAG: methionine ABC transporter ATP-binding protein [Curvibacter sp. PD_MW3]|nr:ATP-binding cassette domain-containing protein [Burkholderiales bacterium]PHM21470.1 MAG: methionine ABC transporter ATP-binding protein [Curvibacter sp. PD_MW3]
MIKLENISVEFELRGKQATRFKAVDRVSLHIRRGEVFGIVGTSGAGKSTLLRTINLLERPSAGRVLVDGEDITDLTGSALRLERHKIGMIFQHFNLMHNRTVFDNAAFALRVAGKSEAEIQQRVPEILKLVGLEDKALAYPSQLSGGQKQRVGIARAVANRPAVLLCDEPTSALDLETSAAILELLKEINERLGITIVLISHEMNVIKKICGRVAVMDGGKVIEEGSAFDIFATPQADFTRQLVAHTLNLDIPEHLVDNIPGTVLKVLFLGDKAEDSVLSAAAIRFGVSVDILHGKIEYIGDRAMGLLVVRLADLPIGSVPPELVTSVYATSPTARVDAAVQFIRENATQVEVLHAH